MGSSRLWDEARVDFENKMRKDFQSTKDHELLREFLNGKEEPGSVRESARKLAAEADGQWIGDKIIPRRWADKIMSNIDSFTTATSSGMDFAPESAKLVWFGVNRVLSAIQSNYQLYAMFGTGLTDITDVMIIILHHDRLYDERTLAETGLKQDNMTRELFKTIKAAYSAVLEFCFAVKRYLKPNLSRKIVNGVKHFFGTAQDRFEQILRAIEAMKNAVLQNSQSVFQKMSLDGVASIKDGVGSINKVVQNIQHTMDKIRDFEPELQEMRKDQNRYFGAVLEKLNEILISTKPKTPFEMALQEFEINMASLGAQYDSTRNLEEALSCRYSNTGQWIFKDEDYLDWINSPRNEILWLTGNEGMRRWAQWERCCADNKFRIRQVCHTRQCGGPSKHAEHRRKQ